MIEADTWKDLPAELLGKIFQLLPVQDLRRAMLVCKRWAEAGEMPEVWANVDIVVTHKNLEVMPEVLLSPRLLLVRKVEVSAVSKRFLQTLARHPKVEQVDMEDICFSGVQSSLLVQALTNLNQVDLTGTQLLLDHVSDLCSSLVENTLHLKILSLAWNDLSLVNSRLLAEAVTKVEDEVDLRNSCLTTEQSEAIFAAIKEASQPRKICMRHNDLSEVDAEVLALGLEEMEQVDLRHTSLDLQQVTVILEHPGLDKKLKKIIFGHVRVFSRSDEEHLKKLVDQAKPRVQCFAYHMHDLHGLPDLHDLQILVDVSRDSEDSEDDS